MRMIDYDKMPCHDCCEVRCSNPTRCGRVKYFLDNFKEDEDKFICGVTKLPCSFCQPGACASRIG